MIRKLDMPSGKHQMPLSGCHNDNNSRRAFAVLWKAFNVFQVYPMFHEIY